MQIRLRLARISWSLADQGIVSGGTFFIHVILARGLSSTDYGIFALLFGGLLTLQVVNAALLFHPLSVRLVVAKESDQGRLLSASLILLAMLTAGLGAMLALMLVVLGRPDLVPPALACFFLGQLQEGLRRSLLSGFRYKAASVGDAVSYLGQAFVVAGLAFHDLLTLEGALYSMAATSAFAAVVQFLQLDFRHNGRFQLRQTAMDYWSIGGGWSLGNALLLQGRAQLLLFGLAASSGAAAVASFQAAINIINLSNPIMLGLCNIIPQTSSQASVQGYAHAWRAARAYVFLATPPILIYSVVLLVAPEAILGVLYGSGSGYLDMSLAVRLLAVAALAGYAADVVVSFLHGVSQVRRAFFITATGALATAVLAVPLIGMMGAIGNCLTHLGANIVRLAAARRVLLQMLGRSSALPVASAA
jgi:O-antigen/teichoic acid export membrane protein